MSRNRSDREHVLVIEDVGGGEREYRVVHHVLCPWEAISEHDYSQGFVRAPKTGRWLFHRCCILQFEIESVGLDSLNVWPLLTDEQRQLREARGCDAWKLLPTGRYMVRGYADYHPGDYGGEWGAEWECGIEFVDDEEVKQPTRPLS
jgi:hypothetical protein